MDNTSDDTTCFILIIHVYRGKNYLHPHTYLFIIAYVLVVVLVVEDIITMHDEGGILSLMYNGREGHSVISTSRSHITKVKPALSQVLPSSSSLSLLFLSLLHFLVVCKERVTLQSMPEGPSTRLQSINSLSPNSLFSPFFIVLCTRGDLSLVYNGGWGESTSTIRSQYKSILSSSLLLFSSSPPPLFSSSLPLFLPSSDTMGDEPSCDSLLSFPGWGVISFSSLSPLSLLLLSVSFSLCLPPPPLFPSHTY